MALLEKYQEYFVNYTKPEYQPMFLHLTADGWKLLIRENLTPIIEERLQMKQISDYVWADAYEDGKRKVLSFFFINDAFATLKWGWNFDFVPKISGRKAVWARTDKSIYSHIYEVSPDFCDGTDDRDKTVMSRFRVDINNLEKGLLEKIEQHKNVFYYLESLITEYYQSTVSYDQILERIKNNMKNSYYRFIQPENLIVQAFIEKRIGMQEKALRDLEALFADERLKNEFIKKFQQT
ncbi:MAG: hypothetical protein K2K74_02565 [Lachnospiraceae bacterium]|nr:hypothetical protein [Lachnospiraceae bacterium]